jgi:aspartyl/asparaginyl-tRNA synthetase
MNFEKPGRSAFSKNYTTPEKYDKAVTKLRAFFKSKGFLEIHPQDRLSILAACEDPSTISTFNYYGRIWPLPQTGQMWLEYDLLNNPECKGLFCVSTSYRNEPNPVAGRHDGIFAMAEFEFRGGMEDLIAFESQLVEYLGFPKSANVSSTEETKEGYPRSTYKELCKKFNVKELGHEHEAKLKELHGSTFFITHFPEYTSPFWNMAYEAGQENVPAGEKVSNKVDVIINGMEVIGSAQRSCNPEEMRKHFYEISEGQYARTLFNNFTKERVEEELEDFLKHKFFARVGGGIGLSRLIRAMDAYRLL